MKPALHGRDHRLDGADPIPGQHPAFVRGAYVVCPLNDPVEDSLDGQDMVGLAHVPFSTGTDNRYQKDDSHFAYDDGSESVQLLRPGIYLAQGMIDFSFQDAWNSNFIVAVMGDTSLGLDPDANFAEDVARSTDRNERYAIVDENPSPPPSDVWNPAYPVWNPALAIADSGSSYIYGRYGKYTAAVMTLLCAAGDANPDGTLVTPQTVSLRYAWDTDSASPLLCVLQIVHLSDLGSVVLYPFL